MDLSRARAIFFEEAREQCELLETILLDREGFPVGSETYNLMFRTAHTLKGSGGLFGLTALVRFSHVVENVFERLRADKIALDNDLITVLLRCNDHLRALLGIAENDESRVEEEPPGGTALLNALAPYLDSETSPKPTSPAAGFPAADEAFGFFDAPAFLVANPCWHVSVRFHADLFREGFDPASFLRYLASFGRLVRVESLLRPSPGLADLNPTECFLGLEIDFDADTNRQRIEDAFEFVVEDGLVLILPPHAELESYRLQADKLVGPWDAEVSTIYCRWQKMGSLSAEEVRQLSGGGSDATASVAPVETDMAVKPDAACPVAAAETAPASRAGDGQPAAEAANRRENRYIRIEAAKLDQLINRVGELVIASSATTLLAQRRLDAELMESVAVLNHLVESIRDDALTLRMVPINDIFSRFPRMVREVSQSIGKTTELEIRGGETEIDKSMVEKLTDPLMHIVRNAIDHGIELPEQRLAAGKTENGTVTLDAYHDSGSVVVEISDDGRGIDRTKVLAKAQERGLVAEGRVLSEQETLGLIFLPGFSTADQLSDLSGRGVGMDVVKRNIEALRGDIEILTKPGEGTTFRLRLPLTLAIIDGFRVEVDESALVIPLDMMIECIYMPQHANEQRSRQINLRGEWVPYLSLRELFGLPPAETPEYVVIVHYGENRAGIVVDRLVGEVQAVIKPLGNLFRSLRGISGSTILGNGKPALILDVPQLIQRASRRERQQVRKRSQALTMDAQ